MRPAVSDGACSISAELAGPGPGRGAGELPAHRVSLRTGVTVQDVTDWPGQVELTLMTQARPVPAKDGLHLEKLGASVLTRTQSGCGAAGAGHRPPAAYRLAGRDLSDHAAFPSCGGTAAGITKEK